VEPLPHTRFLPVPQPSPAGRAAAIAQFLREQAPGTARAQDEDDASERGAIRDPRTASVRLGWFLGQQGFNGLSQVVGDKGFAHSEE
jgi:hypothetical protein